MFPSLFRNLLAGFASRKTPYRKTKRKWACRLAVERLEDRAVPAGVFPNDPQFSQQWALHNTGQTGGVYDADIDMPAAWSVTTGSSSTVIAVLDSGIDYTHPDVYLNIWINEGEIPAGIAANLTDVDSDGIFTFRDLNDPANASSVTNLNGNGYIDGGDLLNDARWENGLDEDINGKVDDLVGWDFYENDNDPQYYNANFHGLEMAQRLAAMGNDGVGWVGVMWNARLMNVRILQSASDRNDDAAGLDYAVAEGATISNNCWGDNTYSQQMYDAIDRARLAGHLFVAAAGNFSQDNDVSPFYPASYNLDNVISVLALNASDQLSSVTNWGRASVDLGSPSDTGATSKATPLVTGVAGLLRMLHPDWTYAQIKAQILATVDPVPSLVGKTVTGGRLNAAMALATTSISISDPTVTESDSGMTQMVFNVTRVGDSSGSLTLNWSSANGTASAGGDYVAASGQLTFAPFGANTQTITINIVGDILPEPTETVFVNLAVVSGSAVLADETGQGIILDVDKPRISISDVTQSEGKKGKKTLFTFTVTLSQSYHQTVTMSYQTVNGTATTANKDYVAKTGTLTFAPGETTKTITIEVTSDNTNEANELFYVDLFGNSSNSLITKNRGIGTILNDD